MVKKSKKQKDQDNYYKEMQDDLVAERKASKGIPPVEYPDMPEPNYNFKDFKVLAINKDLILIGNGKELYGICRVEPRSRWVSGVCVRKLQR